MENTNYFEEENVNLYAAEQAFLEAEKEDAVIKVTVSGQILLETEN